MIFAAYILLAIASGVTANLLINPSFESNSFSGQYIWSTGDSIAQTVEGSIASPDGWTPQNRVGLVQNGDSNWGTGNAPDGSKYCLLQTLSTSGLASISQSISVAVGGVYTVSFYAMSRPYSVPSGSLAAITISLGGTNFVSNFHLSQTWTQYTYEMTMTSGGTLPLTISNSVVYSDTTAMVDNVVLTAVVPLPRRARFHLVGAQYSSFIANSKYQTALLTAAATAMGVPSYRMYSIRVGRDSATDIFVEIIFGSMPSDNTCEGSLSVKNCILYNLLSATIGSSTLLSTFATQCTSLGVANLGATAVNRVALI